MNNQVKTSNQDRGLYFDSKDDIVSFTSALCVANKDSFMSDILFKGFDLKTESWKTSHHRKVCVNYLKESLKQPLVGRNCCGGEVILGYLHEQYPNEF